MNPDDHLEEFLNIPVDFPKVCIFSETDISDLIDMLCVENGESYHMGDNNTPISAPSRNVLASHLKRFFKEWEVNRIEHELFKSTSMLAAVKKASVQYES